MPLENILVRIGMARSPEEVLLEVGAAIADFWVPDEAVAFLRLIVSESASFPELGRTFLESARGPARRAIAAYLRRLHDGGALEIPDPKLATEQFISMIIGSVMLDRLFAGGGAAPAKPQRDHVVREATRMMLQRYRPRVGEQSAPA